MPSEKGQDFDIPKRKMSNADLYTNNTHTLILLAMLLEV